MWKPSRILVLLEESQDAERALEAARGVAEAEGADLLLVSVVPSFRFIPSPDVPLLLTDMASEAGQAQEYLDRVAQTLSDLRVRTLVRVSPLSAGEIGVELARVAEDEGCDLVAMTTNAETAPAAGYLLERGLPLLLLPRDREHVPPGRPVRVHRLIEALGSVFFVARREGSVSVWGLPVPGQEA